MSSVYNPESEITAQIERLELEARDVRRKLEHAKGEKDRQVLQRQLKELEDDVERLKAKLP
jgi:peptidoglycan hydrolase CwlO-like protein